jgi:predicted small lipoprotein YifL
MKKVFLSLALVVALSVSFVSCKETAAEEAPATEEVLEVAPTEEVEPTEAPADSLATETPATEEVAK